MQCQCWLSSMQFGYAFKDEVALFEVAHRPNDDLPAVRCAITHHMNLAQQ